MHELHKNGGDASHPVEHRNYVTPDEGYESEGEREYRLWKERRQGAKKPVPSLLHNADDPRLHLQDVSISKYENNDGNTETTEMLSFEQRKSNLDCTSLSTSSQTGSSLSYSEPQGSYCAKCNVVNPGVSELESDGKVCTVGEETPVEDEVEALITTALESPIEVRKSSVVTNNQPSSVESQLASDRPPISSLVQRFRFAPPTAPNSVERHSFVTDKSHIECEPTSRAGSSSTNRANTLADAKSMDLASDDTIGALKSIYEDPLDVCQRKQFASVNVNHDSNANEVIQSKDLDEATVLDSLEMRTLEALKRKWLDDEASFTAPLSAAAEARSFSLNRGGSAVARDEIDARKCESIHDAEMACTANLSCIADWGTAALQLRPQLAQSNQLKQVQIEASSTSYPPNPSEPSPEQFNLFWRRSHASSHAEASSDLSIQIDPSPNLSTKVETLSDSSTQVKASSSTPQPASPEPSPEQFNLFWKRSDVSMYFLESTAGKQPVVDLPSIPPVAEMSEGKDVTSEPSNPLTLSEAVMDGHADPTNLRDRSDDGVGDSVEALAAVSADRISCSNGEMVKLSADPSAGGRPNPEDVLGAPAHVRTEAMCSSEEEMVATSGDCSSTINENSDLSDGLRDRASLLMRLQEMDAALRVVSADVEKQLNATAEVLDGAIHSRIPAVEELEEDSVEGAIRSAVTRHLKMR